MVPYRNSPRLQKRCGRAVKVTWRWGIRPDDTWANTPRCTMECQKVAGRHIQPLLRDGQAARGCGKWRRCSWPLRVQCLGWIASGSADQLWVIWEHHEAPWWLRDTGTAAALGEAGDSVPGIDLVPSPAPQAGERRNSLLHGTKQATCKSWDLPKTVLRNYHEFTRCLPERNRHLSLEKHGLHGQPETPKLEWILGKISSGKEL